MGRGLRLSVNQSGDRMDHPATVHDINVLTVVASESYTEFVTNLQKESSNSLSARPRKADEAYHTAKAEGRLAPLPPELAAQAEQIYKLIDSVFSESQLPQVGDDRRPKANPLNDNFNKKEFKELWNRINHKAIYRVEFDSAELVRNCIRTLDKELRAVEATRIECARKFFEEINERVERDRVRYDVVTDFGKLMEIVGRGKDQNQP